MARTILDTLRQVSENSTDVGTVFNIVTRLAQDVGKLSYYIHTSQNITYTDMEKVLHSDFLKLSERKNSLQRMIFLQLNI